MRDSSNSGNNRIIMEVNCEYLEERHRYWRERIGDEGIWDADGFKPIKFIVRKRSKTYDGLFCRKRVGVGSKWKWEDQIIFYQQYRKYKYGK